jgi:hypothetical protein
LVEAVKPLSNFIQPLQFGSILTETFLAHARLCAAQLVQKLKDDLEQAYDWWYCNWATENAILSNPAAYTPTMASSSSSLSDDHQHHNDTTATAPAPAPAPASHNLPSINGNHPDPPPAPPLPPRLVNLYFVGESHIQALWTILLHNHVTQVSSAWKAYAELNYMSQISLQLIHQADLPAGTPLHEQFFFEIQFSPGVIEDVLALAEGEHVLPVVNPFPVCFNLSLAEIRQILSIPIGLDE